MKQYLPRAPTNPSAHPGPQDKDRNFPPGKDRNFPPEFHPTTWPHQICPVPGSEGPAPTKIHKEQKQQKRTEAKNAKQHGQGETVAGFL